MEQGYFLFVVSDDIAHVRRMPTVLNEKQESVVVPNALHTPILSAGPTSTRGLTQPRLFFRWPQDFVESIVSLLLCHKPSRSVSSGKLG